MANKKAKPPKAKCWKPGESGNPKGRPPAGATVREHINALAQKELNEAGLRKVARDKSESWARRTAAERMLRTLEAGDLADFQEWLDGDKTLCELREEGVNTELVKRAKISDKGARELELHDRAGGEFDRVVDTTAGKPVQPNEHSGGLTIRFESLDPETAR